jgi:hypothetical protein
MRLGGEAWLSPFSARHGAAIHWMGHLKAFFPARISIGWLFDANRKLDVPCVKGSQFPASDL